MRLQLSPELEAFREEMRTFFTTQVPQEIRDTVAAHRHVSKEQYIEAQRILNAAGLAVPHWPVEWGGRDWTPLQRHIWREEMQLASVPEPLAFNTSMIGPVIAAFGNRGAEGALPAEDGEPRHLVVPGLLRARRRLRPGLAAHHRRPRRRRLGRQRPEDLDDAGPVRRLDLLPGAHRPDRGEEAARHLAAGLPDGLPRRHPAADRADRRRLRGQRGLLRGRPRARRRT